jgi:hypothetical protein
MLGREVPYRNRFLSSCVLCADFSSHMTSSFMIFSIEDKGHGMPLPSNEILHIEGFPS